MEHIYKWKEGFAYSTKAEVVGKVIEEIEARDGTVTKEALLEAARPEDSPIHSMFEWDNNKAAEKYRLSQANKIIIQLSIEVIHPEQQVVVVPAYINVNEGQQAEYKNIVEAVSNQESRELILERLRREVNALVIRNKNIEGFADILLEAGEKLKKGEVS